MSDRVYYDPENDSVTLLNERNFEYRVDLDQLQSPAQVINWVYHLLEKNWVDGETIKGFFEAADDAFLQKYGETVRGKLDCYGK